MPFVVKATYRNETRKFLFVDSHFPSYDELYHQLYRVFGIGHSYYLFRLLFSPTDGTRILIGMEAHSSAEYDLHCASFKGRIYPSGSLIFSVFDETPHKIPASRVTGPGSFIHPIPPAPPTPCFAPPSPPPPPPPLPSLSPELTMFVSGSSTAHKFDPPPEEGHCFDPITPKSTRFEPMNVDLCSMRRNTSSVGMECCSVTQGKKEVKAMMDDFLRDFTRIMGSTFGEDRSFIDPLDTPTPPRIITPRGPSPLPAIELDGSLHIPGSFIQPRPQSPDVMDDYANVEKSQTPPLLEPLQTLHPGIWCDFCGKQIRGLRFKCQECAYYDLCANCIVVNQALDKHNANQSTIHRFNTISPPSQKDTAPRELIATLGPEHDISSGSGRSDGKAVHSSIRCDMCQLVVIGNRHKCMSCADYDLCDSCIKAAPTEHPFHRFMTLATPARLRFHTRPVSPVRTAYPMPHSARCNLCDSRILGDRYKCTDCPDFDTCSSCFAITSEQHPYHSFVKVTKPDDFMIRRRPEPVFHFATCDACNKNIVGTRYKCTHPDCPDFDLCQDCEALPIAVHPSMHIFLKLKRMDIAIPFLPPRSAATRASPLLADSQRPAATPIPIPVAVSSVGVGSSSPKANDVREIHAAPPSPIERLHAIRAQAERRLSARMQQLQSYPFSETSSHAVDPIIEERLVRERKEAEEKARMMDQEIEELERARRRKHDDALKQPSRPYLESVKATLSDTPEVYRNILKLLIECFGTRDSAVSASTTQQIRRLLSNYPTLLEGLDAFITEEVKITTSTEPTESPPESQTNSKQPPPDYDEAAPTAPEMVQTKSTLFGNPFIHPLESPLQAAFLSDNNIPDGHVFPAGAEFVKSWHLKNDGTEDWMPGTRLVFVGGMRLGVHDATPTTCDIGHVPAGHEVDVNAGTMKAPDTPGRYISHWRLRDPQGRHFGPRMWCDIEVIEMESDNSQHGSLVSSAVVMPDTAPEQAASVGSTTANLLSGRSSPVTVPPSTVTGTDDAASDALSVGSVSLADQSDSDWDEIRAFPSPRRFPVPPTHGTPEEEAEYQVLYDSASDDA